MAARVPRDAPGLPRLERRDRPVLSGAVLMGVGGQGSLENQRAGAQHSSACGWIKVECSGTHSPVWTPACKIPLRYVPLWLRVENAKLKGAGEWEG